MLLPGYVYLPRFQGQLLHYSGSKVRIGRHLETGLFLDSTTSWSTLRSFFVDAIFLLTRLVSLQYLPSPSVGFLTNLPVQSKWMFLPINSSSKSVRLHSGDLVQGSRFTSEACNLWSVNETRTVHVHPVVPLVNFSGIRVMEDRIGTSRRSCRICVHQVDSMELPLCSNIGKI